MGQVVRIKRGGVGGPHAPGAHPIVFGEGAGLCIARATKLQSIISRRSTTSIQPITTPIAQSASPMAAPPWLEFGSSRFGFLGCQERLLTIGHRGRVNGGRPAQRRRRARGRRRETVVGPAPRWGVDAMAALDENCGDDGRHRWRQEGGQARIPSELHAHSLRWDPSSPVPVGWGWDWAVGDGRLVQALYTMIS